jgi:hypothetical protein
MTTAASAQCNLSIDDVPTFSEAQVIVPSYEGRNCDLDGWLKYHRMLTGKTTQSILDYDAARVAHDLRIRKFDRKLERALAAGRCVGEDYHSLHDEIELQNEFNAGPRKINWTTAQIALSKALKQSSANISRLNVDRGSICEGGNE